jgi:hypothetical protein
MRKRLFAWLFALVLLLSVIPSSAHASGMYVASKNSDVYHYASCSYVDSIFEKNKIWFDTAAEAELTGRRGCSRCKPSAQSETSGQETTRSQTGSYSKSDLKDAYDDGYSEGYNAGQSAGYRYGREEGYDSGYSKARDDLESEYRKKVEDAASGAYRSSAIFGIPAASVVCMALLNKKEKEMKKKYANASAQDYR